MMLVAGCFAIDSIILVVWQIIDPLKFAKVLLASQVLALLAVMELICS